MTQFSTLSKWPDDPNYLVTKQFPSLSSGLDASQTLPGKRRKRRLFPASDRMSVILISRETHNPQKASWDWKGDSENPLGATTYLQ